MADRFWVGNGGNWLDNTNHWSVSSGGSPGASIPSSSDNVYFDANSFTSVGQIVTLGIAPTFCFNMSWTNVANLPTFSADSKDLLIYGSLTFVENMTVSMNSAMLYLYGTGTHTLTLANKALDTIETRGVGTYTLQDSLTCNHMIHRVGTLDTNGKALICDSFETMQLASTPILTLGASTITCGNMYIIPTNLTLNANTSTIILTGNNGIFAGGGLTYNNVEFQGASTIITGSNTFNDLKFTAGKTVNLTAGTTQTVTSLTANGSGSNIITIQSTSAGSLATLSKSSGTVEVSYCSIQDITATGGATWAANLSTDVSGNSGWFFGLLTNCIRVHGKSTIDKLHIKNIEVSNTDIQNIDVTSTLIWDLNTILLAEFENNLNAGNITNVTETITNWQVTRSEQGSSTLEILDTIDVSTIQYIDYTAQQDKTYIYYIFGLTANQISSALETDPILTDFYGYFLVSKDEGIVYKFDMNVTSGENKYEEDVTIYNNYTQYPAFAIGTRKYMTTTIQALPGTISSNSISQSVNFINDLRDFVLNGKEKLWKSRKGEIFNVYTKNFRYIPLNDGIDEQPMVVSFDVIESSVI